MKWVTVALLLVIGGPIGPLAALLYLAFSRSNKPKPAAAKPLCTLAPAHGECIFKTKGDIC